MNLEKVKEAFVENIPRKKNLLHILHKCHGFREMSKIQLPQEGCCTSGVTSVKLIFLLEGMAK